MTKKYEKFEEWMVGKKVRVDGFEGVVLDRYYTPMVPEDTACIKFKTGDDPCDWMWSELEGVTFIEEAPSKEEEDVSIPWEVGQVVWDCAYGKGIVESVSLIDDEIHVQFERFNTSFNYYVNGIVYGGGSRTLFFSEPVVTAELFPPKKPFVPKLKEGDKVLIKDKQGFFGEGTVRVVHKECNDRIYVSKDGDYFMKQSIESLQVIGEEIKWES